MNCLQNEYGMPFEGVGDEHSTGKPDFPAVPLSLGQMASTASKIFEEVEPQYPMMAADLNESEPEMAPQNEHYPECTYTVEEKSYVTYEVVKAAAAENATVQHSAEEKIKENQPNVTLETQVAQPTQQLKKPIGSRVAALQGLVKLPVIGGGMPMRKVAPIKPGTLRHMTAERPAAPHRRPPSRKKVAPTEQVANPSSD